MIDLGQTADINSTIAALEQGITAIPIDQAIASIESWLSQLRGLEKSK